MVDLNKLTLSNIKVTILLFIDLKFRITLSIVNRGELCTKLEEKDKSCW